MPLAEDDEGDVRMTREAFEFYKVKNTLHEHFIAAIGQIDDFFMTLVRPPRS